MLNPRVTIVWGLLFFSGPIFSQQLSNIRKKFVYISGDTTRIDTFSIVPNSLYIQSISSSDYKILYDQSKLIWIKKPAVEKVEVTYRVFPFSTHQVKNRLSFDSIFYRFGNSPTKISSDKYNVKPVDFGKVNSAGSLGRSLAFGNKQNAVLNSSLNLQLSGYLADSIYLMAAISDNNLPIQPDGSTQNLNEIDKVSIQFSKKYWKLQLGDFDLRQQQQYFLNFYKRLQGLYFENTQQINSGVTNQLSVSGAVAKGKFTRNIFQGVEGNQGPYRLKGANQELFFIVLAGTERVFIDGIMLQRGEDQDYVINYNTAEITFTPKQMITKDKRIQVEFEYADRNYLNSQLYFSNKVSINKKATIHFGYFNNTDARNSSINQTLSSGQKSLLSSVGDQLANAFYSTAMFDSSSTDKILYRKVDTLYGSSTPQTIYVYDQKQFSKGYTLSFYDKGPGNGNYILDSTLQLNGKVFKWIAPDPVSGKKFGRYEPDVLLVAPKSQEIYSLSSEWKFNPTTHFKSDLALSKYDVNTFSSKDKQNDLGAGVKLVLDNKQPISKSKQISLHSLINAEYASSNFKPVERLRSVEFMRDWGLDLLPSSAEEKIISASIGLEENESTYLTYSYSNYLRDRSFDAHRHRLDQTIQKNNWLLNNALSVTQFSDPYKTGSFFRPTLQISKTLTALKNQSFGINYSKEASVARDKKSDSIALNSFSFETFQVFTTSDPNKENKWGLKYFSRSDEMPLGKEMKRTDRSNNYALNYEWMSNEHHQVRIGGHFRNLEYYQQSTSSKKENSLLGRIEYFARYWKGAISGNSLYEVGSGQEPRKTFSFFEVPVGQGEYTWIDYNNDGIQQLNEFEVAKFRDQARFYKIYTPTTEYVKSNYLNFNYNLTIDPSVIALSNSFLSRVIKKFYLQSTFQVNEKKYASSGRIYNPFGRSILDSSLVSAERIIAQTISFNRYSQIGGIDFNYLENTSQAFLSYGPESRLFREMSMKGRLNIKRTLTMDFTTRSNLLQLVTPLFSNRNYNIRTLSYEPKLIYTQKTSWRLAGSYKKDQKNNLNKDHATIHSIILEGKYNLVSNTAVNIKYNRSNIQFDGNYNTSVGYMMLDGLRPGNNNVWAIDVTKRLTKFVELSFQYEGRKSVGINSIHLGRAQIRALL